ncbi:hypothetical protein O6P43_023738 [Quillaja saponaria]|uniref:Uncharacterized protein n=1 Tax=Quillaja saponaria TaxID=32244 RepID=A0AAD7LHY7_QUISA|nr:hypothetical protein O6P43_023738 [Quillaja saponaria]
MPESSYALLRNQAVGLKFQVPTAPALSCFHGGLNGSMLISTIVVLFVGIPLGDCQTDLPLLVMALAMQISEDASAKRSLGYVGGYNVNKR